MAITAVTVASNFDLDEVSVRGFEVFVRMDIDEVYLSIQNSAVFVRAV